MCEDCIFRWWPDGDMCRTCDGKPKNWGPPEETTQTKTKRRFVATLFDWFWKWAKL